MGATTRLSDRFDAKELAQTILRHGTEARTEEDVKIRVESALRPILDKWNIKWALYEHRQEISGRTDALYGTVIIEYKSPGRLERGADFRNAKKQLKDYITRAAGDEGGLHRYLGVLLDGRRISFLRYRKGEWHEDSDPPLVSGRSVLTLLESIRALHRRPIDSGLLLTDFGPSSEISREAIGAFYRALSRATSPRTEMLFGDWRRVFSQACSYSPKKIEGLEAYYGFEPSEDVERVLFAVQTYYTVLMKLLTSEIVTLFADSLLGSYLARVQEAYLHGSKEIQKELSELEEGGIFADLGIRNFLEADYFAWYLDEWNEEISSVIARIAQQLLDYEPATVELNPERVQDLFKHLYQNLVPRDIRHGLGEFFTPDWLSDLLLDEVGFDGNPSKRVLDPACGSGTFLVSAIQRIREYADDNFLERDKLLDSILTNVKGIDLNPLAVLASKANYLIALADLLRFRPKIGIEIPIYLADAISVEERFTVYGEHEYGLHTNEGDFWLPKEVVTRGLLSRLLAELAHSIRAEERWKTLESRLQLEFKLKPESLSSIERLYARLTDLEKLGKDRIWTSLLRNSFAPFTIGRFDLVIGNPPWINWETLPEIYRGSTRKLWEKYGLLHSTEGAAMGKASKDLAMLFVARCTDMYLSPKGKLGFLVPFTLFKTQAGAGFREYLSSKTRVLRIHDLVECHPFEGALNRTAMVTLEHGESTFPIDCQLWIPRETGAIPYSWDLESVTQRCTRTELIVTPMNAGEDGSPWLMATRLAQSAMRKVVGSSGYKAYRGVYSGATSVYWVDVVSKEPLLIENSVTKGKIKSRPVRVAIEPDLLYPLLRGRDVGKWYSRVSYFMPLPVQKDGAQIPSRELRSLYPLTYKYFDRFFDSLIARMGEPYKSELSDYRTKPRRLAERTSLPFYMLGNVSHNFAPSKVVWKYISGRISGKANLEAAVVEESKDEFLGNRPVIADNSLVFVPVPSLSEAHFLCGMLNSTPVHAVVAAYSIETHISTHITQNIQIPNFVSKEPLHSKLVSLSKEAHSLRQRESNESVASVSNELHRIERDVDRTVAEILAIPEQELEELERAVVLFSREAEPEAEEIESVVTAESVDM